MFPVQTDCKVQSPSFPFCRRKPTKLHCTSSGNQLNFILTHNCITENPLVTKLHTSDHFLVQFSMINVFLSVSPTNYVHLYYTAVSSAALRSERTSEQQRRCGTNQSPDRPKNQSLYALTFPNSSSATNPQTFDCCRKLQTSFSSLVLIQNMLYLTKSLIFFHRIQSGSTNLNELMSHLCWSLSTGIRLMLAACQQ